MLGDVLAGTAPFAADAQPSQQAVHLPSSLRLLPRGPGQASASEGRVLHSTRAAADLDDCTASWSEESLEELAIALARRVCTSVVLRLEAKRVLVDTEKLPVAWPVNVTIVGKVLPDGSLPQLLVRADSTDRDPC